MALRSFPEIYPDELLYSVLGRYARNVGDPGPAAIAIDLFGDRMAIASFDLPGRLGPLAERLPRHRNLDVAILVRRTTLCPYYTAFASADLRADLTAAMAGSTSGCHFRLGIAAFTTTRTTTLRFCPACHREMIAVHGEPYWRRAHQIPGVLVCPDHGLPLRVSRVSCETDNRHAYQVADEAACPDEALPLVRTQDPAVLRTLCDVAKASVALLDDPPPPIMLAEIGQRYRQRVEVGGFMRTRRRIDQQRLIAAFRAHFGAALRLLPTDDPGSGDTDGWLAAMTRKQRKAVHPLRHVLLDLFLSAQGASQEAVSRPPSAFGHGPWVCRNPLSDHHGQAVVDDLDWYRNRDAVVGIFKCQCGYAYTRGIDRIGRLGPPRYRAFGPSLKRHLTGWIAEGLSLRAIARKLVLDPKSVANEAERLGLVVPWTCASIKSPGTTQSEICSPVPEPPTQRPRAEPRRDWPAIDREHVIRLRHLKVVILRKAPPVRASAAELERRLGHRQWLRKRRHVLPEANAFVDVHQETVSQFRLRRLEWIVHTLWTQGLAPTAWQACKAVGLHGEWVPVAEKFLDNLAAAHLKISAHRSKN